MCRNALLERFLPELGPRMASSRSAVFLSILSLRRTAVGPPRRPGPSGHDVRGYAAPHRHPLSPPRAAPPTRPRPPSCRQLGSVEPADGLDQAIHLNRQPFQARTALDPLLIHVEGSVDL